MFGNSERRVHDRQLRLVHESRMMLAQQLAPGSRGSCDPGLGEMLDEVVICGQVLAEVGTLAPNEFDSLIRIHRTLLAGTRRSAR